MKISSFIPVVILLFSLCGTLAQEPVPSGSTVPSGSAEPAKTEPAKPSPAAAPKPGVFDYQDLPINDVLRELGRDAKVNLVIGNSLSGNVTFHSEGKTPLQAVEAIAVQRGLMFKNFEGIYYVVSQGDWRELMQNRFFFEAPELPPALAKFKKRYYDALIKEGFTKEEAMKIITSEPLPPRDMRFNF